MKWILAAAVLFQSFAFAEEPACIRRYQYEVDKYEGRSMKYFLTDIYDRERIERYVDSEAGVTLTYVAITVGYPFIALAGMAVKGSDVIEKKYWSTVLEYMRNPTVEQAGLQMMHSMVKNEFDIAPETLNGILQTAGSDWFCNRKEDVVFTDHARQMMGDKEMLAFAYKYHGTPEWERLMSDPKNFELRKIPVALERQKLEERLFALLDAHRVPRGQYQSPANWTTKTRDVNETNARK